MYCRLSLRCRAPRSPHVETQRLPVTPVIEGHPDLCVRRAIEQTGLARVLADGVGDRARCDPVVDLRPRATAVVRAPEMRLHVVDPQRVRGSVGGAGVEVAGLDVEDARPRLDHRRRYVPPRRTTVYRRLDVA